MHNLSSLDLGVAYHAKILDTLPSMVWLKGPDLRFIYVNEALAAFFRREKAAILGQTDADLIADGAQVEIFRKDDQRVLQSQQPLSISAERLTGPDGKTISLATTKLPYQVSGDSGPICVLGIGIDITDVNDARLRAEISSDYSHVIRSPLAGIDVQLQAFMREYEKIRQYPLHNAVFRFRLIKKMLFSNQRCRVYLGKRIAFSDRMSSAVESIKSQLASIWVSSATLAYAGLSQNQAVPTDTCLLLDLIQKRMPFYVSYKPAGTAITVAADDEARRLQVAMNEVQKGHFAVVLDNVVQNALKFIRPNGTVTIRIAYTATQVTVHVNDEGLGISETDLPHVFEAGFTRHAPGVPFGLGIGLFSVKRVCERNGWPIALESQLQVGTSFRVTLPRAH